MTEPNPYEASHTEEASAIHRRKPRRVFTVGMIALLTPVAMFLAMLIGNTAAILLLAVGPTSIPGIVIVVSAPPAFALLAMFVWGICVYRDQLDDRR